MMRRNSGVGFASMRGVVCLLGGLLASGATATALEVTFPKTKPDFALTVPDGWSISRTEGDVEMTSPEKDSLVIATVFKKDKSAIEAWKGQALGKMQAFGVVFDKNVKVPPPSPASSAAGSHVVQDFAQTPDTFTFSGAPSLGEPGTELSTRSAANAVESLTDPTDMVPIKAKFKVVRYEGTTLKGKPVDVEFGVSELPGGKRLFVVMQTSASADMRASAIINSVRGAQSASSARRNPVAKKAAPSGGSPPDPHLTQ